MRLRTFMSTATSILEDPDHELGAALFAAPMIASPPRSFADVFETRHAGRQRNATSAGYEPKTDDFCLSAARERCELLAPEKHPIANALHRQLDTQGLRGRAQPPAYSSRRFAFARRQAARRPSGHLLDIALVLPEPEEGRINGRPLAGLVPRHSTETWHETPP